MECEFKPGGPPKVNRPTLCALQNCYGGTWLEKLYPNTKRVAEITQYCLLPNPIDPIPVPWKPLRRFKFLTPGRRPGIGSFNPNPKDKVPWLIYTDQGTRRFTTLPKREVDPDTFVWLDNET